jgi:hypothetical protein
MKYNIGDLFVSKYNKVLLLILKVEDGKIWTERYDKNIHKLIQSCYRDTEIQDYILRDTWQHFPVKE